MSTVMKTGNESETKQEKRMQRTNRRKSMGLPAYTLGEEIFSSVSHGVSALFAVTALVLLLLFCKKEPLQLVSVAIYGGAMILLYTVSTLYHALGINRAKKVFRVLDHCMIFILIAGTYTPITLVCIWGRTGFTMFCVVWAAAIIGITLNSINLKKYAKFSMLCYLGMGWVVVFAMRNLITNLNSTGIWCLFIGGVFYTLGAVLYGVGKKIKYMHSIWHLFVLAGSVFHTVCVYQIVK